MTIIERISDAAHLSKFSSVCNQVLSAQDPYARATKAGHITASGLVVKDDKVLLIFHPHIKQWFQPGGHIDDGDTPLQAAIREVYEETGVVCESAEVDLEPIDIDLHEIPANPKKGEGAHLHIDLLFLLQAVEEGPSPEGIQKIWLPFAEIGNARIQRALQKLRAIP